MEQLFTTLLFVLLLVFIILTKKQSDKQRIEKQRIEREKEEKKAEENRIKQETVERIKSNDTVCSWVKEMANIIEETITQSPHEDYEFQFRSYTFAFLFGIEIQDIYLEGIKEKIQSDNYNLLSGWEFAKYNLPELKKEQLTLFDSTIAEMTAAILYKKGIDLKIQPRWRVINRLGFGISDYFGNSLMYAAVYERKTANGSW